LARPGPRRGLVGATGTATGRWKWALAGPRGGSCYRDMVTGKTVGGLGIERSNNDPTAGSKAEK